MIEAALMLGREAARRLSRRQVQPGLSDEEFERVEYEFGFEFADDHRAFLACGLPVGGRWPDWRNGSREQLRSSLSWPVEGVLFDVEHNGFWYPAWPPRPADTAQALPVASAALADVPQMVPIYGHRYLPAGRGSFGHPVLSMYQTDIIFYGMDLADYMYWDHGGGSGLSVGDPGWAPEATVPFWRDLVS